jgi:hypothetical protein
VHLLPCTYREKPLKQLRTSNAKGIFKALPRPCRVTIERYSKCAYTDFAHVLILTSLSTWTTKRATAHGDIRLIFDSVLPGHTAETRIQLAFPIVVIGQKAATFDGVVLLVWDHYMMLDPHMTSQHAILTILFQYQGKRVECAHSLLVHALMAGG